MPKHRKNTFQARRTGALPRKRPPELPRQGVAAREKADPAPWLFRLTGKKKFGRILIGSALAHPSFRNENGCAFPHDFDRLEFFGDAVLNFLVCRKLFDRFPQADEGLLSRMRSILVSRKILFRIARTIGLRKYVKIGRSLRHQPLKDLAKILADTLEALIAAIFLEHGHETTDAFIEKYLGEYLAPQKLFRLDPNPKSTLQELTQRYWQTLPAYEAKELVNGFEVRITVGSQKVRVRAPSKSQGEVSAARMMLRKIRSRKGLRRSAK